MNERIEQAVQKKQNGYNCAQAVACCYYKELGMDEETLFALTQAFGAGMGTTEGSCGAISGAAVVVGLLNKDRSSSMQDIRMIMSAFKERNGSVLCKELKGTESGKVLRSCNDCVRDAVEFLEKVLSQK